MRAGVQATVPGAKVRGKISFGKIGRDKNNNDNDYNNNGNVLADFLPLLLPNLADSA